MRARTWLLPAGAALLLLLAACASGTPGGGPTTATTPSPSSPSSASAVPCQPTNCRPHQTVTLGNGYQVALWLSPDQQNYRTRPVVELRHNGTAVQWWTAPQGDGWAGRLTCASDAAHPNCVLTDSAGMHGGVAEVLLLDSGRLVHPAGAQATSDSGDMRAVDLDGDGYLDVVGATNDYQPNYAEGHNFWQTFRYGDGQLVVTGCQPQADTPLPTQLLTAACPPT